MTIDDDHVQQRYRLSSEDGTTIEHFCKKIQPPMSMGVGLEAQRCSFARDLKKCGNTARSG